MTKKKRRKLMVGYCRLCNAQIVREAPASHGVCEGTNPHEHKPIAVRLRPLKRMKIIMEW